MRWKIAGAGIFAGLILIIAGTAFTVIGGQNPFVFDSFEDFDDGSGTATVSDGALQSPPVERIGSFEESSYGQWESFGGTNDRRFLNEWQGVGGTHGSLMFYQQNNGGDGYGGIKTTADLTDVTTLSFDFLSSSDDLFGEGQFFVVIDDKTVLTVNPDSQYITGSWEEITVDVASYEGAHTVKLVWDDNFGGGGTSARAAVDDIQLVGSTPATWTSPIMNLTEANTTEAAFERISVEGNVTGGMVYLTSGDDPETMPTMNVSSPHVVAYMLDGADTINIDEFVEPGRYAQITLEMDSGTTVESVSFEYGDETSTPTGNIPVGTSSVLGGVVIIGAVVLGWRLS